MPAKKAIKKPVVKKMNKSQAKKTAVKALVSANDNIAKTIEKYPQAAMVMMQYGFGCLGCVAAHYETIEEGAAAHGIDANELVAAINKALRK